jgi:CubicO group peptidase (beta-lactamase class C family)
MRAAGLLLIGLAACRCSAPPAPSPLDAVVSAILAQDQIPAAVIVVGDAERVTYRKAFGAARLDTIFDLASCTKVVATTTAALKLVEEGKLSLDDPIGKQFRMFEGRTVTVRDLLSHQSGFPAYLTPQARTPDGILAEIASLKTGTGFRYS